MYGNVARRGQSGLGFANIGPTGVQLSSGPTCVTPDERIEAQRACRSRTLRGLGQTRSPQEMSGRFAGQDPCMLQTLPDCQRPHCIDETTAQYMSRYIMGEPVPDDVRSWIESGAWILYFGLPYCTTPSFLRTPPCLEDSVTALIGYCQSYGFNGPDNVKNAMCWLYMKDQAYWQRLLAIPSCSSVSEPPPATSPPTTSVPPPYAPPAPPGEPPDEGGSRSASMMGVGGILLLVALGGGGYYLYRRSRR